MSDLHTADDAERQEILEDRDEYISENVFWVPEGARYLNLPHECQAAAATGK
jgi:hypothetical protein